MNHISISTNLLEAVAGWALPEGDNRAHLSQILFRDDEMIAYSGTRAVVVPIETHGLIGNLWRGDAFTAVAAQDAMVKADARIEPRRRDARSIGIEPIEGGRLRLRLSEPTGTPSLVVRACTEEMPLEALRKIMSTPSSTTAPGEMGFDPAYLASIDDVVRAIEPARRGVKVVRWGGPLDPMVFEGDVTEPTLKRARFVIMPMRI